MKKLMFVLSALILSASLTFGQSNESKKPANRTETKTVVKKETTTTNKASAPIAHRHVKKSNSVKRMHKR